MDPDIRCKSDVIEVVSLEAVNEDPENIRLHPERNLDAIVQSLRQFGQQKPIVIDLDGVCRAGNGTLAAAKALGWDRIAAVRSDLTPEEARAYAVADNRTADLSEFDREALAKSLAELQSQPELLAAAGFGGDELGELLKLADEINSGETNVEQEEPPATVVVRHVTQQDKDDVVNRINEALMGTGLSAVAY